MTVGGSPIDNSKMHEVAEKVATSSSFSERNKNFFWKIFSVYHANGTGDEIETKEKDEDNGEINDSESQMSFDS